MKSSLILRTLFALSLAFISIGCGGEEGNPGGATDAEMQQRAAEASGGHGGGAGHGGAEGGGAAHGGPATN